MTKTHVHLLESINSQPHLKTGLEDKTHKKLPTGSGTPLASIKGLMIFTVFLNTAKYHAIKTTWTLIKTKLSSRSSELLQSRYLLRIKIKGK